MVRQIELPSRGQLRTTLARVDYHDAFLLDRPAGDDRSAQQWGQTILEAAPLTVRSTLLVGWSSLGLRIGPTRSKLHVLGWEIRSSTRDFMLVGMRSRIGMPAELLFERRPNALMFATLVQHQNPAVRALWAAVTPIHQRIARSLLERAERSG